MTLQPPQYQRVLLKIGGEALAGNKEYGIEETVLARVALEVKEVQDLGCEVALVLGGGNIFRGVAGSAKGMDRTTADHMGMLATVINSLAMQRHWKKWGSRRGSCRRWSWRKWPSPISGAGPHAIWKKAGS